MVGTKSVVFLLQMYQAAYHKARSDQQQEREARFQCLRGSYYPRVWRWRSGAPSAWYDLGINLAMYAWHGRHHAAHIAGLRERAAWK